MAAGNRRATGARYEDLAAEYLRRAGYAILERNFRSRYGEIDIIAERNGVTVYVEVKYRSGGQCGDPMEAVDRRKQQRIARTALYHRFVREYPEDQPCRFDVIGILGGGSVRHIENAFEFGS